VSDKAVAKEFVFNFPSLLGVGQLNLEPVVDILWMHRAGSTDALPSPYPCRCCNLQASFLQVCPALNNHIPDLVLVAPRLLFLFF
jgi:hypothetical protein